MFLNSRKRDIVFTSLATATGITIIEICVFLLYFKNSNQKSINGLLGDSSKFIAKALFESGKITAEDVYAYERTLKPLMQSHLEANREANFSLYIRSFMVVLVLFILSCFSFFVVRPRNWSKSAKNILFGIGLGAVTQYIFVITFVLRYKTKTRSSIYSYILAGLDENLTDPLACSSTKLRY